MNLNLEHSRHCHTAIDVDHVVTFNFDGIILEIIDVTRLVASRVLKGGTDINPSTGLIHLSQGK